MTSRIWITGYYRGPCPCGLVVDIGDDERLGLAAGLPAERRFKTRDEAQHAHDLWQRWYAELVTNSGANSSHVQTRRTQTA